MAVGCREVECGRQVGGIMWGRDGRDGMLCPLCTMVPPPCHVLHHRRRRSVIALAKGGGRDAEKDREGRAQRWTVASSEDGRMGDEGDEPEEKCESEAVCHLGAISVLSRFHLGAISVPS